MNEEYLSLWVCGVSRDNFLMVTLTNYATITANFKLLPFATFQIASILKKTCASPQQCIFDIVVILFSIWPIDPSF